MYFNIYSWLRLQNTTSSSLLIRREFVFCSYYSVTIPVMVAALGRYIRHIIWTPAKNIARNWRNIYVNLTSFWYTSHWFRSLWDIILEEDYSPGVAEYNYSYCVWIRNDSYQFIRLRMLHIYFIFFTQFHISAVINKWYQVQSLFKQLLDWYQHTVSMHKIHDRWDSEIWLKPLKRWHIWWVLHET